MVIARVYAHTYVLALVSQVIYFEVILFVTFMRLFYHFILLHLSQWHGKLEKKYTNTICLNKGRKVRSLCDGAIISRREEKGGEEKEYPASGSSLYYAVASVILNSKAVTCTLHSRIAPSNARETRSTRFHAHTAAHFPIIPWGALCRDLMRSKMHVGNAALLFARETYSGIWISTEDCEYDIRRRCVDRARTVSRRNPAVFRRRSGTVRRRPSCRCHLNPALYDNLNFAN